MESPKASTSMVVIGFAAYLVFCFLSVSCRDHYIQESVWFAIRD